jgi:hypothetical protein
MCSSFFLVPYCESVHCCFQIMERHLSLLLSLQQYGEKNLRVNVASRGRGRGRGRGASSGINSGRGVYNRCCIFKECMILHRAVLHVCKSFWLSHCVVILCYGVCIRKFRPWHKTNCVANISLIYHFPLC